MKRILPLFLALCLALPLFGCAQGEKLPDGNGQVFFNATVLEVYEGGGCLVEPSRDEEAVLRSADQITLGGDTLEGNGLTNLAVGDAIRIAYDGTILETYPAQLATVYSVYLLDENGEIIPMCGNPE